MGSFALFVLFVFPQPTPADRFEIVGMIARLSNEKYSLRERTTVALSKRKNAKPCLLAAIATDRDPETVARCRVALAAVVKAEVQSLCPLPMIDALWFNIDSREYRCPVPGEFQKHAEYLNITGRTPLPWVGYYRATDLWLRDMLATGIGTGAMRGKLAEMHAKDAVFIAKRWEPENASVIPAIVDAAEYLKNGK